MPAWSGQTRINAEQYEEGTRHGHAYTANLFWEPKGKLRTGIEAIKAGHDRRVALELRYYF